MQIYSNPSRASLPHALPDVEVFLVTTNKFLHATKDTWQYVMLREQCGPGPDAIELAQQASSLAGWYYWFCLPGCMPECDPIGSFKTQAEAIADAQSSSE